MGTPAAVLVEERDETVVDTGPATMSLVYTYGSHAYPSVEDDEKVIAQLRLAAEYRNQLVDLENERRTVWRGLTGTAGTPIEEQILRKELKEAKLVEYLGNLRTTVSAIRGAVRKRTAMPPRIAARISVIRRGLTRLRAALGELRTVRRTDRVYLAAIEKMNETFNARRRALRAAIGPAGRGLHWATYQAIEADQDRASLTTKWPSELGRVRFDASGSVAVHIQDKSFPTANIFTKNTRCYIDPLPAGAWDLAVPRQQRCELQRTTLHFAIRPNEWLSLPIVMHRPLPDGLITWVRAFRRKCADFVYWELLVTVTVPAPPRKEPEFPRIVGVDLGWRKRDVGQRIAYWCGSDGREQEIIVPYVARNGRVRNRGRGLPSPRRGYRSPARITAMQSARDRKRDVIRAHLVEFRSWLEELDLDALPGAEEEVLAWKEHHAYLLEQLAHVGKWFKPRRFVYFRNDWRTRRIPGDDAMFAVVDNWAQADNVVYNQTAWHRLQLLRSRRELFRLVAHQLATEYDVMVFEDMDLRKLSRNPEPEEEGREVLVDLKGAPGRLRMMCKGRGGQAGTRFLLVVSAFTTRRCHACGHVNTFRDPAALIQTCQGCKITWDVDSNAGRNLYADGLLALQNGSAKYDSFQVVRKKKVLRRRRKVVITPAEPPAAT